MGLNLTPAFKDKIIRQIHSGEILPSHGQSCVYVKVESHTGAKLYRSERSRDLSFDNQIDLFKQKMAPNCDGKFEIPYLAYSYNQRYGIRTLVWKHWYGYLTQHASKVDERRDFPLIRNFLNRMRELGYDDYDLENDWNIGKLNRRIVCLDTDPRTLLKRKLDL